MDIQKIAELRDRANGAADYATKAPGHVETNGHVIADLYRTIALLADMVLQIAPND